MSEKPNYYAVIPADVRYSKKLNPMERLLYAEITCLTNFKGYCWASNAYFGKLFDRNPKSISRNLQNLSLHKFIKIYLVKNDAKNVDQRMISLVSKIPSSAKTPPPQKCGAPLLKNVEDNTKNEKSVLFSEFWEAYNVKKSRKLCFNKFIKLSLDNCKKCVVAAQQYSDSITDIKFKKHPCTWLNNECWDDEITSNIKGRVSGGEFDGMVF
jgi:hypothetical protein